MSDERREHLRVNRILDFEYSIEATRFCGRVADLSEGGAFVDTTYPQPEGVEMDFRLELPDDPQPVEGRARVVWQQPMLGMGIEFLDLTDEQRAQLRFLIASVYFGGGESGDP